MEGFSPPLTPPWTPPSPSESVLKLKEADADAVGDVVQVDYRQEVDGFEFAVDGWGAAEAGGDVQVGAKEAWEAGRRPNMVRC